MLAALGGDNPRPIHERRLMAYMLAMATGQVGHPVPLFVEMKSNNGLIHDAWRGSPDGACDLPLFKRLFWTLRGREVCPSPLAVRVETPEKYHLPIEVAKF